MRKIIIVAAVVVIALGAGFTYTLYKVGEGDAPAPLWMETAGR